MEFDILDGVSRPRLQVQSGDQGGANEDQTTSLNKVHASICVSVGIVFLGVGLSVVTGLLQFLAVWLGVSLMLGPFAPPLLTGGDCRVGIGEPVLPESEEKDSVEKIGGGGGRGHYQNSREKYNAPRQAVEIANGLTAQLNGVQPNRKGASQTEKANSGDLVEDEKEWDEDDLDLLRKLVVKHPRGTLRRWEVIAEALGRRHSVDSVVKMSKARGQKMAANQDSFSRFLSDRKAQDVAIASPLSRRDEIDDTRNEDDVPEPEEPNFYSSGKGAVWTEVEDKALLTALRTFPKDTSMRWDKVALALPGRSKAQCFRRFSDLRKSFRSTVGAALASQEEPLND